MRKLHIIIILVILLITGCSANLTTQAGNAQNTPTVTTSDNSDDIIYNGYIIDKDDQRLLVAWGIEQEQALSYDIREILDEAHPNAIWFNYESADEFNRGDKVTVWGDELVKQSYPASQRHIKLN